MEVNAHLLNKVARITLYFWIMKVLATTLGEVLGDFFSMTLNLGYLASLGITMALFARYAGHSVKRVLVPGCPVLARYHRYHHRWH